MTKAQQTRATSAINGAALSTDSAVARATSGVLAEIGTADDQNPARRLQQRSSAPIADDRHAPIKQRPSACHASPAAASTAEQAENVR